MDEMMEDDPLFLWLLAPELSVEDAAILIAGGDPGAVDYEYQGPYDQGPAQTVKRTKGHPGFTPVFASLRAAVRRGELKARVSYPARHSDQFSGHSPFAEFHLVTRADLERVFGMQDRDFPCRGERFEIQKEPDWAETTVEVSDLREWLKSRGFTRGFFFRQTDFEPDAFMDPTHDHFAPELALAVAAWRALASEQKFPRGVKAGIEAWIDANPDAWRGDDDLKGAAKDRVVTLANWRKIGGAPTSGG
ncbi:hypothetical protein Q9299_09630 [Gemmobacter fulvus]|uniref:hypothetical protein n=1 Tax=Gemmobacter fulvus TaxID=2840474 RepID=UPI0027965892|nr:hypothetical protein [Gemmobacter fulvus]MDQ1848545.1 hypothetical protein [Gemmobacter fulvus]